MGGMQSVFEYLDYRDLLIGARLPAMTSEEALRWQEGADRALERWNAAKRGQV